MISNAKGMDRAKTNSVQSVTDGYSGLECEDLYKECAE